ncbi:Elongator complex protein 4 [Kickxella alabastrina]|uniref:Elongator complex protein 4 n=1 Tax=Kickxella alabastrina TaxID=61397 RepID=UPI00221EC9D8|nr:Elongator complex protein 4 [Kickxella alabastrina]KAI7826749.1 Elongator complex protein 4 [Kickxella alabastrina]
MSSSFRKRVPAGQQAKPPPATRLNPHSAQLLVSTGVPSLDDVLGGGLPVGGVLLIEQDRQTGYSNTLLSYFASQAIAAGHKLCIVNADQNVDLKTQLPGWASALSGAAEANKEISKGADDTDAMKIAWRYKNLPKISSMAAEVQFCERFDLSLRIPGDVVDKAQPRYDGDMYRCVLDRISELVQDGFSSLTPLKPNTERTILRIELRSLGSGSKNTSILQFLHELRGLLRYSYAACVISFPVHLYEEAGVRLPIVRRIEHLCDAVIELESFEGTYASPADIVARQTRTDAASSQDYHGFLHIHKLPRLNSLTASMGRLSLLHTGGGSANNLAFRLRRKKFSIETYHLPIEGGTVERRVPGKEEDKKSQGRQSVGKGGVGCGSTPGRKDPLEF